ncbi:MAG: fibrobacter succinogenes major paralogous domain-containing protein [Bacteroidales bacterium]
MSRRLTYSFIIIALFVSSLLHAQVTVIYSEPAVLVADGYKHGNIQWQSSADQTGWTDVPGLTGDSATLNPDTNVMYYRGEITSGSCDTLYTDVQAIKLFQCGDTITDYRDGRTYSTVQIGNQCWMGKNMAVGTMIHGDSSMKDNGMIERYCFDNDTSNCDQYGALYQWDELMQYSTTEGARGICPKGWHVPSDQEVLDLEMELGMSSGLANMTNTWRGTDQGTQLSPSGSSGFDANYTGVRFTSGLFYYKGSFEYIYTSTANSSSPGLIWRRCLDIAQSAIGRYNNTPKGTGGSVRCIKD